MSYPSFVTEWNNFSQDVHTLAIEKGWWEGGERNKAEMIALMHSELSEALEGLRHGNPPSDKIPEFSAVEEELADVVIRIMDFAEAFKFDVARAIPAKHEYNKGRAHKHGGKIF